MFFLEDGNEDSRKLHSDIGSVDEVVLEWDDGEENTAQLHSTNFTFNGTTMTPPDSSSLLRNSYEDHGDLDFSVVYVLDGNSYNGIYHFGCPPSGFKNLIADSYDVYDWRLHARNSSIRGDVSSVLDVVTQNAISISRFSTSSKIDVQFQALDEVSAVVSHFIERIEDGSNSSFTFVCLTAFAFVTTLAIVIIARDISTRKSKKSTCFGVDAEYCKGGKNNRRSFPSSPGSTRSSGRQQPTTPKSPASNDPPLPTFV